MTKQSGRKVALDSVSLVGERGAVVALLGENGADKTTALRILLGLLEPDGGWGRFFGLDSWNRSQEIPRRIGYPEGLPTGLFKGNSVQVKTVTPFLFTAGFYPNSIYILSIGDSQESLDGPNVKYVTGGSDHHSSRLDIAVWELPKNAGAVSETSEVDKAE